MSIIEIINRVIEDNKTITQAVDEIAQQNNITLSIKQRQEIISKVISNLI